MTFDPFGDFETRGYLRNHAGEKDVEIVKRMEHRSFLAKLDDAIAYLGAQEEVRYDDLREVHHILFEAVYPWAGEDRTVTAMNLAINRGPVLFAHPESIRIAAAYGLSRGNDPTIMREKPGEVMGYLAHAHPFLDGNGRALMVTHIALAERAGISIDWPATDKVRYLDVLTQELNDPGKGHLDSYLAGFVRPALGQERLAEHVMAIPGLDSSARPLDTDEVAGNVDDPDIQARYEQQERKYEHTKIDRAEDKTRERDDDGRGR